MRKRWGIVVPLAIGCAVVALGVFTALQKHFGLTVEQEALQACEKLIRSSFRAATVDAPTMRREGQYEILNWHRYKIDAPKKPDTLVEKPITCKFDAELDQVIYLGFH